MTISCGTFSDCSVHVCTIVVPVWTRVLSASACAMCHVPFLFSFCDVGLARDSKQNACWSNQLVPGSASSCRRHQKTKHGPERLYECISTQLGDVGDATAPPKRENWWLYGQKFSVFGYLFYLMQKVIRTISFKAGQN